MEKSKQEKERGLNHSWPFDRWEKEGDYHQSPWKEDITYKERIRGGLLHVRKWKHAKYLLHHEKRDVAP